ncbi:MAG TPA: UDP-3-O-(3-hydroxymyristoyl)glucosamine N-acyltransferase [Phycisphaerae bacterium]|nr:UDP-3-O-(3-hydroxymyristoyl)glucosamine N-acyltransferase [Phycisphaerae bacterium]HNU46706.1 UDP-3-O-(3-hydroxymyristoyl)glucosamine N-acyltransferase [Phycisphaerae bacterium]
MNAISHTLDDLARIVEGSLRGASPARIVGVADVAEAGPGEATFVSNPKYAALLADSRAGVVLVPAGFGPTPMPAIECPKIERSVALLLGALAPPPAAPAPGVHPSAVVESDVQIGPDPAIGPHVVIQSGARVGARCVLHAGVFIGRDTTVGDDCLFWPHVVIRDGCRVGHRVIIHPNAVIGADGFGFYFHAGRHCKVPHVGGVVLGDDVEVGACTCIDRSKFGDTVIGEGTKIDNLVQLAHNVRVGAHCLFAGHAGVAGSVRIGKYCVFGGRAAALDNLAIGDGARLAGGLAVASKDVPPGVTISGFPGRDHRTQMREQAMLHRLPALLEELKALRARVERLEAAADHQP